MYDQRGKIEFDLRNSALNNFQRQTSPLSIRNRRANAFASSARATLTSTHETVKDATSRHR
jgi:hypothetical protein